MKKYIFALAAAAMALTQSSCSEDVMDRINTDNGNPPMDVITAKLMITDAMVSTAFSTASGDYSFYTSIYNEQLFGTANNQFKNAELRQISETASSTTFNNTWNSTYGNLENIKQIIEKCQEGGVSEGQKDIEGMAQLCGALCWGYLTDMHGDIPCSEALQGAGVKQPKIDKQEDVYKHIFSLIDGAIANFEAAIAGGMRNAGAQDVIYGNDNAAWLAAAHAVKARYKLHMMKRDPQAADEAAAEAAKALQLGFEGLDFDKYDGSETLMSPWPAFQYSRDYCANSKTMLDILAERNDPRKNIYINYYYQGEDEGEENGELIYQPTYGTPGNAEEATAAAGDLDAPKWISYSVDWYPEFAAAKTHIVSLSEMHFILAELQARKGADVTADLTAAVQAAFDDTAAFGSISMSAADYVASLAARIAADPLKEVMTQKYIAQGRDEQAETYTDLRRCKALGKDCVKMTNPKNVSQGQNRWPLRLPYGNSDVSCNDNVRQAYGDGMYIFTENIWIFGGSR